ncbi:MAG TPA: hypothetical protein PLH94_09390 [Fimbriimonadaceae bacterium]|nr:hypothetical protein [Fimbriimonadaceae bacterium]
MKALWKIGMVLSLSAGIAAVALAQGLPTSPSSGFPHFGADAFAPFAQSPFGTRIPEFDAAARRFAAAHSLRSYVIERSEWMAGFQIDSRRFAHPQGMEIYLHNQRSQGKYRVMIWNWAAQSLDELGVVVLTPNEDVRVKLTKPLRGHCVSTYSFLSEAADVPGTMILALEADDPDAPEPDFTVQWIHLMPLERP